MKKVQILETNSERPLSFETSEEVLLGIIKAFSDFEKAQEDARK